MVAYFYAFLLFFASNQIFAQAPAPKSPWAHESELGVVLASGNTNTENYNFKQQTTLSLNPNIFRATAAYLKSRDTGQETSRRWSIGLRYERELSESVNAFINHLIESDIFAGMIQRNSTDIGLKFFLLKTDADHLFSEVGYRNSYEQRVVATENGTTHYGRIYAEWNHTWQEKLTHKLWVEYLPNFSNGEAYLINAEPSLSMHLTDIFSIKLAYLINYKNLPAQDKKRLDTLYSTVLTATF